MPARLRIARRIRQEEAAVRAGMSRNTAYRLEKGDPGIAIGQVLRYGDAIAPSLSLVDVLARRDLSLKVLEARERTRRVRLMSHKNSRIWISEAMPTQTKLAVFAHLEAE